MDYKKAFDRVDWKKFMYAVKKIEFHWNDRKRFIINYGK